jgi:hypothetical protein
MNVIGSKPVNLSSTQKNLHLGLQKVLDVAEKLPVILHCRNCFSGLDPPTSPKSVAQRPARWSVEKIGVEVAQVACQGEECCCFRTKD